MSHPQLCWLSLIVLPSLLVLDGCGTTIYLDKLDAAAVGQPPAPPSTGTSTSDNPLISGNPQDPASADRWLRLSRTQPTQSGDLYIGTFTQNVTQKAGVDLVGFVPKSSKITMTVFFESAQGPFFVPMFHIDLRPTGNIELNNSEVIGTFAFDHLVGIFASFDLAGSSPSANLLIRGGGRDASVTIPIPPHIASKGIGRVRILAPFEGVNAPNGSFLVNEIFATIPN